MPDEYDEIALRVLWFGSQTDKQVAENFATAFREAAKAKTCASCQRWKAPTPNMFGHCEFGLTTEASWPAGRSADTFGCTLHQRKETP